MELLHVNVVQAHNIGKSSLLQSAPGMVRCDVEAYAHAMISYQGYLEQKQT